MAEPIFYQQRWIILNNLFAALKGGQPKRAGAGKVAAWVYDQDGIAGAASFDDVEREHEIISAPGGKYFLARSAKSSTRRKSNRVGQEFQSWRKW